MTFLSHICSNGRRRKNDYHAAAYLISHGGYADGEALDGDDEKSRR